MINDCVYEFYKLSFFKRICFICIVYWNLNIYVMIMKSYVNLDFFEFWMFIVKLFMICIVEYLFVLNLNCVEYIVISVYGIKL